MRIVLIFPPPGRVDQPYPSLPALAAFMRREGYEVVQRDINIEAVEDLLTEKRLARAWDRVSNRLRALGCQGSTPAKNRVECETLASVAVSAEYVIRHIDEAKGALRSTDLSDLDRYIWATNLVKRGRELLSAEYYPSSWNKNSMTMPRYEWSMPGWLAAARDEDQNIFFTYFRDTVLPSIEADNPDLIGISVSHYGQIIPSLTLARLLKSHCSETHVCLGGAYLVYLRECLNSSILSLVDSIVIGEGEHALLSLARALENGSSLGNVPNLLCLDGGQVRATPTHVEDVNDLPAPDYRGLPLELYLVPEILAFVPTERGCYWRRCAFCVTSKVAPGYRPRKIELVLDDMKRVSQQLNARYFFLSNDAMPPARMKALAEAISREGLDFVWETEARLEESLTPKVCRTLAAGGCRGLWLGLESGSQRVLDVMDKGITVDQAARVIHNCYDAGIFVHLTLMVGFPTETYQEARETLDFVKDHRQVIQSVDYAPFILASGSKVYSNPERYGITRMERSTSVLPFPAFDYEVSCGLTAEEVALKVHLEGKRFLDRVIRGVKGVRPPTNHLARFRMTRPEEFSRMSTGSKVCLSDAQQVLGLVPNLAGGLLYHPLNGQEAVVFNPTNGEGIFVPAEAKTLLAMCNGKDTVEQIVDRLASTGEEADFIKLYCLGLQLCTQLIEREFLTVAQPDSVLG